MGHFAIAEPQTSPKLWKRSSLQAVLVLGLILQAMTQVLIRNRGQGEVVSVKYFAPVIFEDGLNDCDGEEMIETGSYGNWRFGYKG